jgi:hypothetical protein
MPQQRKSDTSAHGRNAQIERRTAERFASVREASCSPLSARHATLTVRLRDVSANGIGLLSPRRFERGTLLLIEVVGDGEEQRSMLVGKVVHITAPSTGNWLIGCALVRGLNEDDVRALAGGETPAK